MDSNRVEDSMREFNMNALVSQNIPVHKMAPKDESEHEDDPDDSIDETQIKILFEDFKSVPLNSDLAEVYLQFIENLQEGEECDIDDIEHTAEEVHIDPF